MHLFTRSLTPDLNRLLPLLLGIVWLCKSVVDAQEPQHPATHIFQDQMGRGRLAWEGSSRNGTDVIWRLAFEPEEGAKVAQLQAEIVLPREHWRLREVKAAAGSSLRVTSKTTRLDAADRPSGEVLLLTISARSKGNTISRGVVAHVRFSPRQATAQFLSPPLIRAFTTAAESVAASQAPLEPPPADPPANPAVGCFFFSH